MRRIVIALLVAGLVLVPATAAGGAGHLCPGLEGSAKLNFGSTLTGKAKVVYDGEKMKVGFVETAFVPTGDGTADVFFDWFFPEGTVSVVEHSTMTPLNGPLFAFESTIEVLSGGSGSWTWSGVANVQAGIAHFDLEGTLCIGE